MIVNCPNCRHPVVGFQEGAEIEQLRKDAERYRRLRAECDLPSNERTIFVCPPAPSAACNSAAELDAAVDGLQSDPLSEGSK